MEWTTIVEMVSNLGFPIVCCIALIYSNYRSEENNRETISKLQETINNNSIVLTKLCEKLDEAIGRIE